MKDGKVRAELSEFIVIELPGVVQDDNLGNFESVDDVFLYEISGISLYFWREVPLLFTW